MFVRKKSFMWRSSVYATRATHNGHSNSDEFKRIIEGEMRTSPKERKKKDATNFTILVFFLLLTLSHTNNRQ